MQDNTERKLDKVDSYLTKFGIILKKHWGKLLLIGFGYFVYWFLSLPADQSENEYQAADTVYVDSGDTTPE